MAPRVVVLISVDDMRFDAPSCETDTRYLDRAGLAGIRDTPTWDAVADAGTRFSRACTTCTYTPPAHASMFTGLLPPHHGVRAFMRSRLPSQIPTLASILAGAGFTTIASIDMAPMFSLLGLAAGFQRVIHLDDAATLDAVAATDGPAFLFAHFEDVHPPIRESLAPPEAGYNDDFYDELIATCEAFGLEPPVHGDRASAVSASSRLRVELERRHLVGAVELPRYLLGVNKFDGGRLATFLTGLERVADPSETLLILTSDHGQGVIPAHRMGDATIPQKFDHGEVVCDEVLRIPLVISGAGVTPGVCDTPVSLADIAPTVLEACGVAAPGPMDGRSLLPAVHGGAIEPSSTYAEVWFHDRGELSAYLRASVAAGHLLEEGYATSLHERTVREGRCKLVIDARGRAALFDVDRDPYEEVDLLAQSLALGASGLQGVDPALVGRLHHVIREVDDSTTAIIDTDAPSSEDLAQIEESLRSLGYVD